MKQFKVIILSALLLVILASCGNNHNNAPEYVVDQDKLVPLLVDIHLTDALFNKERKPHAEKYDRAIETYPSVLLKHDIDRAIFDSTIRYYVKFPKEFATIYDEVLRELSILEGSVQEIIPDDIEE